MKKTNKEAMINFHLFIKFGEKKYIKKLFEEGELFLNTVDYYTKQENKEIGDSWEDVVWTEPITDFKSRVNNTVMAESISKCKFTKFFCKRLHLE